MIKNSLCLLVLLMLSTATNAFKQPTYLFAHGLYNDYSLAYYYQNINKQHVCTVNGEFLHITYKSGKKYSWNMQDTQDSALWLIQEPMHSFNFPDATRKGFDGSQTSLGQENEIRALTHAYEKVKHTDVVIMGMSRGASTILNFLGTRTPSNIAAVIVESPFDSITNTLENFCKMAGVSWLMPLNVLYASPNLFFSKFNPKGIFPIKVVQNIQKDLPILIIASLQDDLIPALSTAAIYSKLRETDHPHVHFLLLEKGAHGYLLEDEDAHIYLNAVHAFYKKYELPHNKVLAAHGESILAQCQPSSDLIIDAIKHKRTFITHHDYVS